ncbi:MAG: Gx transporter family protein [Clostridiaceae bacterium]|nr:Gx transporter family protein [Clostridiaceae bacterium]
MVLSYVEAMIPLPLLVPGMKLGLANLVTVVGLYTVSVPGTAAVALLRIVLVGLTFGNSFSMIYGLAGGLLSLVIMVILKKTGWFSQIGVSVAGGIGHNIGQLCIAVWVTKQPGVLVYLPALLAAGTAAGAVIGVVGGMVAERVGTITKYYK